MTWRTFHGEWMKTCISIHFEYQILLNYVKNMEDLGILGVVFRLFSDCAGLHLTEQVLGRLPSFSANMSAFNRTEAEWLDVLTSLVKDCLLLACRWLPLLTRSAVGPLRLPLFLLHCKRGQVHKT